MREIKFRAWDLDAKCMVSVEKAQFHNGEMYYARGNRPDNSTEVMQFTGLKDKNGVEIYEGDIVKLNGYVLTVDWCACSWKLIGKNGQVHCDIGEWDDYWGGEDETKIEVIGNIYENKELLK